MKKKVLNGLLMGGIGLLAMSSVAAVTLTSCESSQTTPAQDATMKLYNEYNEAVANAVGNQTGYITKDKADAVIQVMDNYISQAQTLNDQIQESGSVDEQIWISSVLFQLQSEKLSVTTEAYLLGAPIGGNIISAYSNDVVDYASYFDYGKNLASWTGRINTFEGVLSAVSKNFEEGLAKNTTLSGIMVKLFVSNTLQKLYGPQLDAYVKTGLTATAITSSKESTNLITVLGKSTYFQDKVKGLKKSAISDADKATLLKTAEAADAKIDAYLTFLVTKYWYGVSYGWNTGATPDAFGLSVVVKGNTGEATNTFEVAGDQSNTIKGLGLTQTDLNTKDIGIGFSTGKFGADSKWNGKSIGLTIYEDYLLYKNTTIYNKAVEVNKEGLKNVGYIVKNMKGVAEFLASKLTSEGDSVWTPQGYTYDENIFDNVPSKPFEAKNGLATKNDKGEWVTSDSQLLDFFKWLNADQWFFGRDVAPNQVVTLPSEVSNWTADNIYFAPNEAGKNGQGKVVPKSEITESLTTKPQASSTVSLASETTAVASPKYTGAKYSFDTKYVSELGSAQINSPELKESNFGDAGDLYQQYVVEAKGIAPGAANISGAQAYAGASFSMDSYYRLRDAILPKVTEIFIKSADSDVHAPSQLDLRTNIITGVGGAAYANGGTFYLDVNPFYGLQKWSMTTLLSHESLPGHNLQMIYAVDNTSSEYAPQLSYTSYAEGWGLFSEWLASQYGSYGEPAKVTGAEWQDSAKRMQLPDFDDNAFGEDSKAFETVNINVKEANATMRNGEFMNGSYETDFKGLSTTDSNSLDQGYYNAMQYFGFLNERQLRAMRMALDTSVHAGGPKIANGVLSDTKNANIGTAAKGTGWSLQDEMDFMHANSGLGQGDITREAQRYLNYTAQATSYLTGENVIEGLFGDASAAYAAANNGALFMNYADLVSTQNNTAPFFNLILRNNDIPLKVLEKYVKQYITENIGAIPAKAAESSSSK